jgi:hypothetical protein
MADRAQVRQHGIGPRKPNSERHFRHFRFDHSTFRHQATSCRTRRRFVDRQFGRKHSIPSRRGTRSRQQTKKTVGSHQTGKQNLRLIQTFTCDQNLLKKICNVDCFKSVIFYKFIFYVKQNFVIIFEAF